MILNKVCKTVIVLNICFNSQLIYTADMRPLESPQESSQAHEDPYYLGGFQLTSNQNPSKTHRPLTAIKYWHLMCDAARQIQKDDQNALAPFSYAPRFDGTSSVATSLLRKVASCTNNNTKQYTQVLLQQGGRSSATNYISSTTQIKFIDIGGLHTQACLYSKPMFEFNEGKSALNIALEKHNGPFLIALIKHFQHNNQLPQEPDDIIRSYLSLHTSQNWREENNQFIQTILDESKKD